MSFNASLDVWRILKENNMKKIIMMCVAGAAAMLLLSGCNTVNGIGKDFEKLGEKVQDASKK